jgi:uncharacterized protein YndB with AHSA1/START domain
MTSKYGRNGFILGERESPSEREIKSRSPRGSEKFRNSLSGIAAPDRHEDEPSIHAMTAHLQNPSTEFVITRTFEAPRERVWKAWTEPDRMRCWWGPKGFTVPVCKMDLRPGGTLHYGLRSPDGHEMWGRFVYREIVAPERLVAVNSFSDAAGGVTRHPLADTWPMELLSTFEFVEEGDSTVLTVRWRPLDPTDAERTTFDGAHEGMRQGWTGTLDQLAEYLAKA